MEVPVISVRELLTIARESGDDIIELIKIDIDGPEIFALRALAEHVHSDKGQATPIIRSIILEATVSVWDSTMGISDDEALGIFDEFYDAGYTIYLVSEDQFEKFPPDIMNTLDLVLGLGEGALRAAYRIPRRQFADVLFMTYGGLYRVTKNLFLTRDAALA